MDILATFIVPAANVEAARAACDAIPGGSGMFTCALSADGTEPATHYASSGYVRPAIYEAAAPHCSTVTTDADPHAAFAAAGLQIITDPA